jgi:hypothetical protein
MTATTTKCFEKWTITHPKVESHCENQDAPARAATAYHNGA